MDIMDCKEQIYGIILDDLTKEQYNRLRDIYYKDINGGASKDDIDYAEDLLRKYKEN